MSVSIPRESLEYVLFPLTTAPVDPASLTHEVAFVGEYDQPSGWQTAAYTDGEVRVLVSASPAAPAGGIFTLDVGRWRLWWKSSSNPEYPVRQVGVVQVV